jgi:subtilase family serine protease
MNSRSLRVPSGLLSLCARFSLVTAILAGLMLPAASFAEGPEAAAPSKAPSRLVDPIDEHVLVTLKGNVRQDLASAPDLGVVEDGKELHLFLLLQRTTAQQADLDNLIERQQQPTAAEYHKWLTPKEFGARFGASPEDIAKVSTWLQSHGFQIRGVLNNASMIDFAATAGQVREAFHTELHYFNIRGGKHLANVNEPQIPAALAPVVAGIKGLAKIPPVMTHTATRQGAYDKETHRWHIVNPTAADKAKPTYAYDEGYYFVSPQDLYTIYNVNPQFTAGNLAASATVAVIEESDIEFGTLDGTGQVTAGGDVNTFRSLFGVPGTLTMHVMHGAGSETCTAPGIDPDNDGEDQEASLDAEWINATAPSANEIFMSCDQDPDNGIFTSIAALIDNNISDVMSMSYGESELYYTSGDYTAQDTLYAQAATQGQSFFVSSGDSGSDVKDQNTGGTATSGINVSAFGSPLTTVAGGTDFSDLYDDLEGGPAQSTYWSSTNSTNYGDALSYVPETSWNQGCASSILTAFAGFSGAGFCGAPEAVDDGFVNESVVGGSGGISTHYAAPAWQTGISGYSNTNHAQPDIAGFASAFVSFWGHALIYCDSNPAYSGNLACTSDSAFGLAGGTSFVAPYMAGVAGLLRNATGSRQGVLNPVLYALGKAQYTAQPTECYSNGQASNTGVTTGLPAASCIFNDITTGNNDVPCEAGSTSCYVNSGDTYGMLSLTGTSSLSVAFPSAPGFDQSTGLGSVNVNNLITKWNTAFTSSTGLMASQTSITSSQSTELTATVTGGNPTGYVDTPPALTGQATFKAGATLLGSCTLSGGTCQLSVAASSLQLGANSVTATYSGSGTYPSSVSSIVTVTVTGGAPTVSLSSTSLSFGDEGVSDTSASQSVTLTNTGASAVAITSIAVTGTNASSFVFANSCGSSLAVGANCSIHGHFTPAAAGALTAAVTITDNASGSPQAISLSGTGVSATTVSLSSTSLSFGYQEVSTTSLSQSVTLTNTGSSVLAINSIAVTGTNASSFVFANSCGSSLAIGANCTIHGHFTPAAAGALTAAITITDSASGSPQTISLSGTGVSATTVSLSSTSVSFGYQEVSTTSLSQSVTLTNTGSSVLAITSIAVTGTNASSFVFANSCGSSLAIGANCTIHGHFTPAATGALTAAVTITDSASGSPQSITLTGTGVSSTTVSLSSTSLSFGPQNVGTTSASQSVTLTNTVSSVLAITSIAVTGTNASSFVFANSCGSSLAIGANCTIHGHFTPTATGALTAAVTITDSASGSPQCISLCGTGQ